MLFVAVTADRPGQHHILTNAQRRLSIRHEAQATLKDAHAALLTVLVVDHGTQQAGPQRQTHRRHFAGDRAWQDQRLFPGVDQLLDFRVNKAVGDHFLIAFVVQQRFYALQRQVGFTMGTHDQTRLYWRIRNVVVAINASHFFDQIFFDLHVETPARGDCLPFTLTYRHFAAEALQNVGDLRVIDMVANQAIQFATTQGNGGAFWQGLFVCHVDHRAGFTAAEVDQQTRGTLQRFILQRRIDAALIAMRGIGVQAMTARAAGNGQRAEERAFQQHVLGFVVNAGVFPAEDPAHRQRFVMVSNNQGVTVELRFRAIEQHQGFTLFRHAHHDPAFDTVAVKGVHRLAQLKQDIVSHVNHRVDGADPAAAQLLFHPQRGRRFDVDAFHHAAQIARARLRRVNLNRQHVVNGRGNRRNFRRVQRRFVQHSDIARHTDDTQAVGTVWRDADFDSVIVKLEVFTNISADRRIRRQFDDTAMVVGNTQLGERAQHPF